MVMTKSGVKLEQFLDNDSYEQRKVKAMSNLLRNWPLLERLECTVDIDFSQEIGKLKNLKYLKVDSINREQIQRCCQNKSGLEIQFS